MDRLPEWLTSGEAARYLGVSRSVLCSWVEREDIVSFKTPLGRTRIRTEDLQEFLIRNIRQ